MKYQNAVSALICGVCVVVMSTPAVAQTRTYRIPAGSLKSALDAYARQSGRPIIYKADQIRGFPSQGVSGTMSTDAALEAVLAGSPFRAQKDSSGAVAIVSAGTQSSGEADAASAAAEDESAEIVVTGSRIRGASSPSPLRVISGAEIRNAGQSDLGEVARSLPQNFNGGQNPEVGVGAPGDNQNVDSASTLNLRGLGADATLTLLNGHRLAYDGASQGIDISAIPLAAVDRIEIVPDGASALYGSDAVGGVANVILKRDFRGLEAAARIDIPTEGGGTEQQYSATAGGLWTGGGMLATYSFDRSEPITAGQRGITERLAPSTTLLREQSHHSALVNIHHEITKNVMFEVDGLYSTRRSSGGTPFTLDGDVEDLGVESYSNTKSLSVSPRFIFDIANNWQLTLQGLYARNNVRFDSLYYSEGAVFLRIAGCACNQLASFEASAEGALFSLPGGSARLAFGGGLRNATFLYTRLDSADVDRERRTLFGYGELSLPLVSSSNAMALMRQLVVSVAGRYERYNDTGGVLSPKLGIVYTPIDGIDLKGTWGRSFKAPTLFQQYTPSFFSLVDASDLGFVNYPAGSTIGIVNGGNSALKAERARTWSATIDIHPETLNGARLTIGYFNVDFTDRVQVAVDGLFGSLGNPIYDPFILASPSAPQVAGAIAATSAGLQNQTGRPFDPADVVAIVDSRYRNVTSEHASGVDVAASYTHQGGNGRSITGSIDASYLTSSRILIPGLSTVQLAGTVFYPPRFRGRGGLSWSTQQLTLAGYLNHIGGVEDRRTGNSVSVRGQTTVDLSMRFRFVERGWLSGTELAFTVQNALNDLPAPISTGFAYATPYDSTNYSAVGRVVGFQLSRKF